MVAKHSNEVIYKKEDVSITVSKHASTDAIDLLKRTIYGTAGPKYQHSGQDKKVKDITDPHFFDLHVGERLVATYCLSKRLVNTPMGVISSFYGRYLAVDPKYGGKGYGSQLKSQAVIYVEHNTGNPHMFYSYIEEANGRSMGISAKENFTSIGKLETLVFSRIYPKTDSRVCRLASNELDGILSLLNDTYQDHILVQFDKLYWQQNYFVLKEKGEIIAGVQANPVLWRIVNMPGIAGKIIMHVLPHIPVIQRLINPSKYQFAALEAIYVKPGREDELLRLLESILVHFKFTSALTMLDINSPIYAQLKKTRNLGVMNSLKKKLYSHVMIKLNGVTEGQIKKSTEQPVYVSAFDWT